MASQSKFGFVRSGFLTSGRPRRNASHCKRHRVRAVLSGPEKYRSLRPTVSVLWSEKEQVAIYLVGVIHGAQSSVEDVAATIRELDEPPASLVLELCDVRARNLLSKKKHNEKVPKPPSPKRFLASVSSTANSIGPAAAAFAVLISSFYSTASLMGFQPGLEFVTAVRLAPEPKSRLILADEQASTTLGRLGDSLRFPDILTELPGRISRTASKLRFQLTPSSNLKPAILKKAVSPPQLFLSSPRRLGEILALVAPGTIFTSLASVIVLSVFPEAASAEESFDLFAQALEYLPVVFMLTAGITLTDTLIDFRDVRMEREIRHACRDIGSRSNSSKTVVAVVGLAHVAGISRLWSQNEYKDS